MAGLNCANSSFIGYRGLQK